MAAPSRITRLVTRAIGNKWKWKSFCKMSDHDAEILLIEPFYGGSHRQLLDLLSAQLPRCDKVTLPAKKWHWKARTSALYISQVIPPKTHKYKTIFASSVLNLAELVALRPDLGDTHKILYFHEHQLVYPVRKQQERDFQYGYNQILSCMVADSVLFNSQYCMESFLTTITSFMKLIPDHRPANLEMQIRPKCKVLYFPIVFPQIKKLESKIPKSDNFNANFRTSTFDEQATKIISEYNDSLPSSETSVNFKTKITENVNVDANDRTSNIDEQTTKTISHHNALTASPKTFVNPARGPNSFGLSGLSQECQELINNERKLDSGTDATDKNASHNIESSVTSPYEEASVSRPVVTDASFQQDADQILHIVWPHRWEHDKNPELFFSTLYKLADMGLDFRLSVLGEQFSDWPEIFHEAHKRLTKNICSWGYQACKEDYYKILTQADVVVSTADHEFFGVAMLEAVHCGCYPLCPNKLAYPEIFPKEYLYNTPQQLFKKLREFCRHPHLVRKHNVKVDAARFSWNQLKSEYLLVFHQVSTTKAGTSIQPDTQSHSPMSSSEKGMENVLLAVTAVCKLCRPTCPYSNMGVKIRGTKCQRNYVDEPIPNGEFVLGQAFAHELKSDDIIPDKIVTDGICGCALFRGFKSISDEKGFKSCTNLDCSKHISSMLRKNLRKWNFVQFI